MDIHKNAKLTSQSRAAIVGRVLDQGQPPAAVAGAVAVERLNPTGMWPERVVEAFSALSAASGVR